MGGNESRRANLRWLSGLSLFIEDWRVDAIHRELRLRCPRLVSLLAEIPSDVQAAWFKRTGAPAEVPHWQPREADWALSSAALVQFFELCRLQSINVALALPSKAADSVWHVWLAHDASGLALWQHKHFGRVIAHCEVPQLAQPLEDALAHAWVAACRSEGLSPLARKLPLMFEVDRRLQVPGGWAYGTHDEHVFHRALGARGKPVTQIHHHLQLGAVALAGAGLLSSAELGQLERRQRQQDVGGGSAGGASADGCTGGSDGCGCGSGCGSND